MTLREAADVVGVKVRTMREWIRIGKIKAEKDKNNWYWIISNEEVERINANKG